MKFEVNPFNLSQHKALLESWFHSWRELVPPWELIAPTGLVVSVEDTPIVAGFLTKTDAGLAIITNIISDKNAPAEHRDAGVRQLIDWLQELAKDGQFKMICVSTSNEKLASRFMTLGYSPTHEKFINLGRLLWHGSP